MKSSVANASGLRPGQTRLGQWLRVLRPLGWWLLLVLVLYGHRTHQRLLAQTRLQVAPTLAGKSVKMEAGLRLDGQPFRNGSLVSLGRHTLAITHPKADPYLTNLSIWYGERDLGEIELERTQGTLAVAADPRAAVLTISGPGFRLSLTNSPGMTSSVPTDNYVIRAQYSYWQGSEEAVVSADTTTRSSFAPKLGALSIESNQAEAEFELRGADGRTMKTGMMPTTITGLPVGTYKVVARFHGDQRQLNASVVDGQTNAARLDFIYGTAVLESVPAGATVSAGDGRERGRTPLRLPELPPGQWKFTLRLDGYLTAAVTLDIVPLQTNSFQTNLVKRSFALALEQARRAVQAANYPAAIAASREALQEQPGNSAAEGFLRQANVGDALQKADNLARRRDYAAAMQQVEAALAISPEDEKAKALAVTYKNAIQDAQSKVEEGRRQQAAAQRARRPREYFEQRMGTTRNSPLFDQQEIKVKGSLADVEAKLVRALTNQEPVFKPVAQEQPDTETFFLQARQSLKLGGWRRCDLVGGQTGEGEVTLVFKVFEYAYAEELSIRAIVGSGDEKEMVPVHASRLAPTKSSLLKRRDEGIQLVRSLIRQATGEWQFGGPRPASSAGR